MVNNRNEHDEHAYDAPQEESEYHFSDEEVSYEADTDTPKPEPVIDEPQETFLNKLNRSKRMIISLVVFLVLVFVVYKMIAPTSTPVPSTDITAQQTPAAMPATAPKAPVQVAAQPPAVVPVTAPTPTMPQSQMQPVAQIQVQPPAPAPIVVQPAPASAPVAVATQSAPAVAVIAPPNQVPAIVVQPAPPVEQAPTVAQQAPPVAPQNLPQQAPIPTTVIDTNLANAVVSGDKVLNQMEAQYVQKLTDYTAQNKVLQDQVQTLNTKVASIEAQMTQLIQLISARQNQEPSPPPRTQVQAAQPQSIETKVNYNVQAIIPGRAWLRSVDGETVTVTEGDTIRDLGRVTKIDPYDGVVEINTGSKIISLSYGNGSS